MACAGTAQGGATWPAGKPRLPPVPRHNSRPPGTPAWPRYCAGTPTTSRTRQSCRRCGAARRRRRYDRARSRPGGFDSEAVRGAMTTRVVSLTPTPDPGDTLLLDGRPTVVLYRLPGRNPPVRVTGDLPCGTCQAPVRYDTSRCQWWCPSCSRLCWRPLLWQRTHKEP